MTYKSENDLLSGILDSVQLEAEVFAYDDYCGAWQLDTAGGQKASFHLVGRGHCWLQLGNDRAPVPLQAGDLVLIPLGRWHLITPDRDPSVGSDTSTTVLCGYFDFGERRYNPILDALPDYVLVPSEQEAETDTLGLCARLLLTEARGRAPGRQLMLNRLAESLFVTILRQVLGQAENPRGLLAALQDARLSRALAAVHRDPSQAWSIARMAAEAAMSRTTFSTTFHDIVGMPPMRYLMALRMHRAKRLLQESGASVAEVAAACGYDEPTSFRRAFSRFFGMGPGAVRRGRATIKSDVT
ncbi:cupin domain-containing protein [Halomonas sp. GXIMD04776]|uniref:AraC family transcriptional regulator n=1 Tax=Halomonas sp. GXIMD04776 TaxID=3415605 RepID=UPI003C9F4565